MVKLRYSSLMKAPRITLDQWNTLQAVIDHGGYAQAAHALHCSQSSVSYTIARMQEQLAMPLLRIEDRKAVLTPTGRIYWFGAWFSWLPEHIIAANLASAAPFNGNSTG